MSEYVNAMVAIQNAIGQVVEDFEGKADTKGVNRLPFPAPKGGGGSFKSRPGVKVHHGGHGEVFELAAGTKLADTIPSKGTPEIPLDRWLAATMLGDRCEDKAALDYARDSKSISGSATGVILPESFQGEWIDKLRSHMVLEAAGMTTATMTGRTATSARVVSDPPVGWRAEGAPLAAGDPTFALRQLVANSLAVRVQATADMAQDSPNFGTPLLDVMGKADRKGGV